MLTTMTVYAVGNAVIYYAIQHADEISDVLIKATHFLMR